MTDNAALFARQSLKHMAECLVTAADAFEERVAEQHAVVSTLEAQAAMVAQVTQQSLPLSSSSGCLGGYSSLSVHPALAHHACHRSPALPRQRQMLRMQHRKGCQEP